jgi:hypothetical protein
VHLQHAWTVLFCFKLVRLQGFRATLEIFLRSLEAMRRVWNFYNFLQGILCIINRSCIVLLRISHNKASTALFAMVYAKRIA